MLNIIFFTYFLYLSVRLFSKRKLSGEYSFLALLTLYVGLLDICNTNATIYTTGKLMTAAVILIKAVLIITVNYKLIKTGSRVHKRRSSKVVPIKSKQRYSRTTRVA